MRYCTLSLVLLLTSQGSSLLAAVASDFTFEQSPPFESQALGYLPYRMYQAQEYDLPENQDRSYPLIVWLHGLGERGTNNTSQLNNGVIELANDTNQSHQPAFIIAPQADRSSGGWASRFDPASAVTETRLILAIEDLKNRFRIDPDRIYVMGLSYGGAGTWNVVTHRPGYFAAAVPMSQPAAADNNGLALLAHFPIWVFDGSNDSITSGTVNTLRNQGGRAYYTIVSGGGHNSTTWKTPAEDPDLYKWMMTQRRAVPHGDSSLPHVKTVSPEADRGHVTGLTSVTLSGTSALTADSLDVFSSFSWHTSEGSNGTMTGTTSWSSGTIPISGDSNLIQLVATASNDPTVTRAGTCSFNDSIMINDSTPPELFLLNPVSGNTYIAPNHVLTLRGYARDNSAVTQIKWSNSRGGSGLAGAEFHNQTAGQVNWFIPDIPLRPGHNTLQIEALDLAGNSNSHTLYVYRPINGGGNFFHQDFDSSTNLNDYIDTSLNPAANSFFDIQAAAGAGSVSIVNNSLEFMRPTGASGVSGLLRRYALEGSPQDTACVSFDLSFPEGTPDTFSTLGSIIFGYFLGDSSGTFVGGNISRNVELSFRGFGADQFRMRVAGSTLTHSSLDSTAGSRRITWYINSSDQSQPYLGPDGSMYSVASERSDVWVDTALLIDDAQKPSSYGSRNLNHFKMLTSSNQPLKFSIDNLTIANFSQTSPLGDWLGAQFTQQELPSPEIASAGADRDQDGLVTLVEYALASDPNTASAEDGPQISTNSGNLSIEFTRITPTDITYDVQVSDSLQPDSWTSIARLDAGTSIWTGTATVNETGTGDTRSVTITDTQPISSQTSRFIRILVTHPSL